jgi:hypothetical protein
LPEALERIIWTALAKDPAERFQTADEFWGALANVEGQNEQSTEATPRPIARPRGQTTVPRATPMLDRPTRPQLTQGRSIALSAAIVGLIAIGLITFAWFWPRGDSLDLTQGQAYLAEGRFQLAADSFSGALTQAPDNVGPSSAMLKRRKNLGRSMGPVRYRAADCDCTEAAAGYRGGAVDPAIL